MSSSSAGDWRCFLALLEGMQWITPLTTQSVWVFQLRERKTSQVCSNRSYIFKFGQIAWWGGHWFCYDNWEIDSDEWMNWKQKAYITMTAAMKRHLSRLGPNSAWWTATGQQKPRRLASALPPRLFTQGCSSAPHERCDRPIHGAPNPPKGLSEDTEEPKPS